jgi:DNA-binding NarL/FixJ family response regulator
MELSRTLIVEDHEDYLRFLRLTLQEKTQCQVIAEASDGLEAVRQAEELQPELVLLDIGLPRLNGIEAARRIRKVAPNSKMLFVSQNSAIEIVEAALGAGALGYLLKSDVAQLPIAVETVLQDKQFVSASLAGHNSEDKRSLGLVQPERVGTTPRSQSAKINRHQVEFYRDDAGFVDGFARFIEAAFKSGNAVIVVATESHHANLLRRLVADGMNPPAKIEEGSYIPLDVVETLSSFMANDSINPILFEKLTGHLIMKATRGAKGEHRRVAACGEGVHILLAAGNLEATIMLERLWDEIAQRYEVDVLCGYFRSVLAGEENISTLEQVCAEHSAVHGRELCC